MKWRDFLEIVAGEPVFTSSLLRAGKTSPAALRLQLSRWTEAGKIIQLRRGVYALAPPFRRIDPHPFLIANYLRKNSYVSLQSALAYYGLIPEHVPVVSSVTTARPEQLRTGLGVYIFKHVKPSLFFGFTRAEVSQDQEAFVATPEKALLDLVYLTKGGAQEHHLRELRLQDLGGLDREALSSLSQRMGKPKIARAAERILRMAQEESFEAL